MRRYDLYTMLRFSMQMFTMYVEAGTIAVIAMAVAQGIMSALGYLGKAGVVKIPELERKIQ